MADVFRKQYRELAPGEKLVLEAMKSKAEELHALMENVVEVPGDVPRLHLQLDGRCAALARTNLEQAVMWATKAITG